MGLVAWLFFQPLYLDTVCALEDLLTSLLQQNMTPQGLQIMIEVCRGGLYTVGSDGISGFFPASSPAVVRYYRDSLIVSLGEGASEQIPPAWATLTR